MTEFEFEFFSERISKCEAMIEYCSHMMITSSTSSDYYWYYKKIQLLEAEIEYWNTRAKEKGIYII